MNFGRCGNVLISRTCKSGLSRKKDQLICKASPLLCSPLFLSVIRTVCVLQHVSVKWFKCVPGAQCTGINGGNATCTTWRKPSQYAKVLEIETSYPCVDVFVLVAGIILPRTWGSGSSAAILCSKCLQTQSWEIIKISRVTAASSSFFTIIYSQFELQHENARHA